MCVCVCVVAYPQPTTMKTAGRSLSRSSLLVSVRQREIKPTPTKHRRHTSPLHNKVDTPFASKITLVEIKSRLLSNKQ